MRQLTRLIRYVIPFMLQLLPGVVLLASVGFLEAFRLITDRTDLANTPSA